MTDLGLRRFTSYITYSRLHFNQDQVTTFYTSIDHTIYTPTTHKYICTHAW